MKPNWSQWDKKLAAKYGTFFFLFQLIDIIISPVRDTLATQNFSSSLGHSVILTAQSHKSERASLKKRANQQQQLMMSEELQISINLLHMYMFSVHTLTIKISLWHWDCPFECLKHMKGLAFFSLWTCLLSSKLSNSSYQNYFYLIF